MEEIIEKIINYGKKFGEIEVIYYHSQYKAISYRNKKYHKADSTESEKINIRIVNGKKYGTAITYPDEWRRGVDEAVKNMKLNSKLKYEIGLPSGKYKTVNPFSKKVEEIGINEMREIIENSFSEKFFNVETEVEKEVEKIIYANKEIIKTNKSSYIGMATTLKYHDTNITEHNVDYKPFNYDKILKTAEEKIEIFANKNKFKSKKVSAVFSPNAGVELIETLLRAFSGSAVLRKNTYLHDKYKKKVFSSKMNLKAIPTKKMVSAYSFDAEGTPSRDVYLIRNGKVCHFLLDRYTSNALNMKNTAHSASLIKVPYTGSTGPYIVEGGKNKVDGELFIEDAMGWHTVDPISGNVSISLANSTMNGKSVDGGMIAFNLYDALHNAEFDKKTKRIGKFILPKIKIDVQFIG